MIKLNDKIDNLKLNLDNGQSVYLYDLNFDYYVLYFYPKDLTSGCTIEALGYKELNEEFIKLNTKVLGISKDSIKSHQKFIFKEDLPFSLVSDESLEIVNYFDIYKEKSMYGRKYMGVLRTTYILDKDYKVIYIKEKVNTKTDALEALEFIKKLK